MPRRLTNDELRLRSVSEDEWQSTVIDALTWYGWKCFHNRFVFDERGKPKRGVVIGKGFPDLIAFHPADFDLIAIELKTETGTATPEQLQWLAAFECQGIRAALWRPRDVDTMHAWLDRKLHGATGGGAICDHCGRSEVHPVHA